jgi:hypothetical protein
MGGVCAGLPTIDTSGEVTMSKGKERDVKVELGENEARELMQIPNVQVVIDSGGSPGGLVAQGNLILAYVQKPREMTILFVGKRFADMDGGFYYPLLSETPVCMAGDRVITLDGGGGDFFAVNLPKNVPDKEMQKLMELLAESSALLVKNPSKKDNVDAVATALMTSGGMLTKGIGFAAQGISVGLKKGSEATRANMKPAEKEVKVSETTKMAVSGTRYATKGAVKVSGTVIEGLCNAAMVLGQYAGEKAGEEAAKRNGGTTATKKADEKEHGAIRLGKAGFLAGAQVFDALTQAGDKLATETADETGKVVGARYGADAAQVTRDGMAIVGDAHELQSLVGKKVVGKLAVKASMYTAQGLAEGAGQGMAKGGAAANK